MDPYYRYYGGNNVNGYLNTEVFNLDYEPIPNYRLMRQPEIPVELEPSRDYYMHDYQSRHHEMQQIYFDNNRHGNHGSGSPRNNNYIRYAQQRIPFAVPEAENELLSHLLSVDIRLSNKRYINSELTDRLHREDLHCQVRGREVITVTGYPRYDNRNGYGFLELVQNISGDRRATIINHR